MYKNFLSTKSFCYVTGILGILGVAMIGASFAMNPSPPASIKTTMELIAFGKAHFAEIMWGGWLQSIGPLFLVMFAIGLVYLAKAAHTFVGSVIFLGGIILMFVSLLEVVFYMSALNPNPDFMSVVSVEIIHAVQHLYFIIAAPCLFLPLGVLIVRSNILPKFLGYFAFFLGISFFILGMVSLTNIVLPDPVTTLGAVQAIWWILAAILTLFQANRLGKEDI